MSERIERLQEVSADVRKQLKTSRLLAANREQEIRNLMKEAEMNDRSFDLMKEAKEKEEMEKLKFGLERDRTKLQLRNCRMDMELQSKKLEEAKRKGAPSEAEYGTEESSDTDSSGKKTRTDRV